MKAEICEKFKLNREEFEISMGMSNDFEKAVKMLISYKSEWMNYF